MGKIEGVSDCILQDGLHRGFDIVGDGSDICRQADSDQFTFSGRISQVQ